MRSETFSDASHISSSTCDDQLNDFSNSNCLSSNLILLQSQISSCFLHPFSEFMLCREIIWMLMGIHKLALFNVGNAGYLPTENVPSQFYTILTSICNTANQMLYLKSFCFTVLIDQVNSVKSSNLKQRSTNIHADALNEYHSTLTYQAFATAVRFFIHGVHSELLVVEQSLQNHEYGSILSLFHSLNFLTKRISYFYTIYSESTLLPKNETPLSRKDAVQYLLDNLWKKVIQCDLQMMYNPSCSTIVIVVFLFTIAPILNFINQWLTDGIIHDKHKEFFIQDLMYSWNYDELYLLWRDCCTLSRKNGLTQSPLVFHELESEILAAGKAISSLSYVGIPLTDKQVNSLYSDFIVLFFKEMENEFILQNKGFFLTDCPVTKCNSFISQDYDEPFLVQAVYKNDRVLYPYLFSLEGIRIQDIIWREFQKSLQNQFSSPLFLIFKRTLNRIIMPFYEISSSCLAFHLHSNSVVNINIELKMLYNLYLFGDSLTMRMFTETIFASFENFVCLQDSLSLTNNLHQTLSYSYPKINYNEKIFVTNKYLGNLNDIKIHYNIDTLSSIVITPPIIQQYQHLFSFLLNIRWVEWILHRAKFFLQRLHQVHMETFFVIHEMNFYMSIISQYFFQQIILVEFKKFIIRIKSEKIDTDILVNEHQKFINSIFSKCFLDVNHCKFLKLFDKLFCICSKFCLLLIEEFCNHITFNNIKRELRITIKRLFTVLRISTIDYNFEFLKLCLNYNNYISANIIC